MSTSIHPLAGAWTYRSFLNQAQHVEPLDNLLFAEAELIIHDAPYGAFAGILNMGDSGNLVCKGSIGYGTPFAVRFQGIGLEGPPLGWVYDYIGYLVPDWPQGVDQVPAIVGSVVRSVAHSDGKAKAGVVASFIAVRHSA